MRVNPAALSGTVLVQIPTQVSTYLRYLPGKFSGVNWPVPGINSVQVRLSMHMTGSWFQIVVTPAPPSPFLSISCCSALLAPASLLKSLSVIDIEAETHPVFHFRPFSPVWTSVWFFISSSLHYRPLHTPIAGYDNLLAELTASARPRGPHTSSLELPPS